MSGLHQRLIHTFFLSSNRTVEKNRLEIVNGKGAVFRYNSVKV